MSVPSRAASRSLAQPGGEPVRVRQIPAAHPYVQHLLPAGSTEGGEGRDFTPRGGAESRPVVHLPDPPVPGAPPGQWWPHPALDLGWVRGHAAEQDVIHLHFGTEGRTTEELAEWVGGLRLLGLPLVHTVHDIDHPHLEDQGRHQEHLALLVEAADGLLTLTEGAAAVVERDHGRRPLVVPHPHSAPLERISPATVADRSGPLRVGLHLKSLRTNLAPLRVLPPLVDAVAQLRDAGVETELEVLAHPDLLERDGARHAEVAAWWRSVAAASPPGVRLAVVPRMDDDGLWDYLAGLDVSVLSYAWGTHSGWVEGCRDLGTWVLAPDVGHLVEQGSGSVLSWGEPGEPPSVEVLVQLLARAADGIPPVVTRSWREAQRSQVAAVHERVYAAVRAGNRVDASLGAWA